MNINVVTKDLDLEIVGQPMAQTDMTGQTEPTISTGHQMWYIVHTAMSYWERQFISNICKKVPQVVNMGETRPMRKGWKVIATGNLFNLVMLCRMSQKSSNFLLFNQKDVI